MSYQRNKGCWEIFYFFGVSRRTSTFLSTTCSRSGTDNKRLGSVSPLLVSVELENLLVFIPPFPYRSVIRFKVCIKKSF